MTATLLVLPPAAQAGASPLPPSAKVRLPDSTVPGLSGPGVTPAASPGSQADQTLNLTFTLRRSDQPAFEQYLSAISDSSSPLYHHYLTQAQLTTAFGPSQTAYDAVRSWLVSQGFTSITGSADRLTLGAKVTRGEAERAFDTPIDEYRVQGRTVYANTVDPALPAGIAGDVQSIGGLNDVGQPSSAPTQGGSVSATSAPQPNTIAIPGTNKKIVIPQACAFVVSIIIIWVIMAFTGAGGLLAGFLGGAGFGLSLTKCLLFSPGIQLTDAVKKLMAAHHSAEPSLSAAAGTQNTQKIGLVEFDTFQQSDVANWLSLIGVTPSQLARVSEVPVDGGVATPGPGEDEVLLDIETTLLMTLQSQATVTVYDAPPSTSFEQLFNAMIGDGDTVISNSWSQCEDETSLSEAQAIDSVLQQAEASGISVFNGSGDDGATCLDGSPDTVGVPADSPHATAVGGSSLSLTAGGAYGNETWWNGTGATPPTGQGGYGVSKDFPRPSYQDGLTAASGRSVPDVVAPADPEDGMELCQADAGGCPDGRLYGGTSMAAPEWAAMAADLNAQLGHNIGDVNDALYPLADTPAFHTAADLSSDFAHVGLGDVNYAQLLLALEHSTAGNVDATASTVASTGDSSLLDTDGATVSADGTSQGTVRVDLYDANDHPVSGKAVSLAANAGCQAVISAPSGLSDDTTGSVVFTVTDAAVESCTFTATDTTDGVTLASQAALAFVAPTATGASINAIPTTLPADGTSTSTVTVYLENALDQPAVGKTVTLTQTDGSATVIPAGSSGPGDTAMTNAQGNATFVITDTTAETDVFTAVDATDGNVPVPGTATVSFTSGTVTACNSGTPGASDGYSIAPFSTGYQDIPQQSSVNGVSFGACDGVAAPAFDANGNAYVADNATGRIYVLPPGGGTPSAANELPDANFGPQLLNGLAFGTDGELYAVLFSTDGDAGRPQVVQLNPTTGAVVREVATESTPPDGIQAYCAYQPVVDPINGNLFLANGCTGIFLNSEQLTEIVDPSSATPTAVTFSFPPNSKTYDVYGELAFAPDGSLYGVVNSYGSQPTFIYEIAGPGTVPLSTPVLVAQTSSQDPTEFFNGLVVTGTNAQGAATQLTVDSNVFNASTPGADQIYTVDVTGTLPATPTEVVSPPAGGTLSTGDLSEGPDGCVYVAAATEIDRLGTGTCATGSGSSTTPALTLTTDAPASPATGSPVTLTATLDNVSDPAGTPVHFTVAGANTQPAVVDAGPDGSATFTYSAEHPGTDTITATASTGSTGLTSNLVNLTWVQGKDTTFLSMNGSQQEGVVGVPATVTANLVDVSPQIPDPIARAAVTLSLGTTSCRTTTDAGGNASCTMTPTTSGLLAVGSSYPGSAAYTAATGSNTFSASAAAPPPLSVATTTLAGATEGSPYSASLSATGGTSPYAWSLAPGSALPAGLSLSAAGVISGTPTAPGTTDFTVVVGDASVPALTATASLSITVAPAPLKVTSVNGYWLAAADGGVFSFGGATYYGSEGGTHLNAPVVGMAATPDGRGYWLVASDGGIFAFGDARFYGSTGAQHLNAPIVAMAATPDGRGYWLVASDGGIFAFGDATFYGSTGALHLNASIVGMAATPDGDGYWLVATDGGVFSFGDAEFYGSTGNRHLNDPVVGIATTPDHRGYWLDASDGGIFAFGDAAFYGSTGGVHLNEPAVGMAATPDGGGYWLDASDGGIFAFGDAAYYGSTGSLTLDAPMVAMAASPTITGIAQSAAERPAAGRPAGGHLPVAK